MMLQHIVRHTLPAAYAVLPPATQSQAASALIMAIGWQETRFVGRRQLVGPARGFYQFERTGVEGVLGHARTADHAQAALVALCYDKSETVGVLMRAIEHNDTLATVFARLLLWTLPEPLPSRYEEATAWHQYLGVWRPGRPRPETWSEAYRTAWACVLTND